MLLILRGTLGSSLSWFNHLALLASRDMVKKLKKAKEFLLWFVEEIAHCVVKIGFVLTPKVPGGFRMIGPPVSHQALSPFESSALVLGAENDFYCCCCSFYVTFVRFAKVIR